MSKSSAVKNRPFYPYGYNKFSVYLKKRFDVRVQKIPINAGFTCPNLDGTLGDEGCIYCGDQGAAGTLGVKNLTPRGQMLDGIRCAPNRYAECKFIAYFQSYTNTYASPETLNKVYGDVLNVDPRIIGLSVGTRADCLSDEILDLLAGYAKRYYLWLEIGLQSAHDKTLSLINRGHDVQRFTDAVERSHSLGIQVCAHVILGLPGEGRKEIVETAHYLNALGVEGVKIHNLYILKQTGLAAWYEEGKVRALTFDEYVRLACDFLSNLSPRIVVQRLTANPPHDCLLTPAWVLKKGRVINAIEKELRRRDAWQGTCLI